ncbi:phosphatidylinositol-4-phosphate 5-kinase [Achlya hypogyna]|uniref:Phosphatidylinositol-4-phosphate 5-kinase n=1 Tax=Achlya hypogyna TaxID=1202772 RepID=A0A1V9Z8G5_ACHHY|nr:phosphatidylinositol-4-phosphate 5-kinase [Achlya hypogyna]
MTAIAPVRLPGLTERPLIEIQEQIPVYEGKESNGLRTGVGKLVFANGDTYVGDFAEGYRHGKGVFTYDHGTREYDGDWKLSLRHGKGKETWRRGAVTAFSYEGDFYRGQPHGYGIERKPQAVYAGDFARGVKEGTGRMVWANGDSYDGQWRDGRLCGLGKLVTRAGVASRLHRFVRHADGSSYDGHWVHGLRHGRGKAVSKDEVYDGLWKEGLRHGEGTVVVNAHQRSGVWDKGVRIKWTTPEKLIK